jgi:hypothetical protein
MNAQIAEQYYKFGEKVAQAAGVKAVYGKNSRNLAAD